MLNQRLLSGGLIAIATLFAARLYLEAPWYLNRTDFLIRPLLMLALPLLLIGGILALRPASRWPPLYIPVGLLGMGCIGLVMQGGWPPPNLPTTWEDSYQTLSILEIVLMMLQAPLWAAILYVIVWRRRKPDEM